MRTCHLEVDIQLILFSCRSCSCSQGLQSEFFIKCKLLFYGFQLLRDVVVCLIFNESAKDSGFFLLDEDVVVGVFSDSLNEGAPHLLIFPKKNIKLIPRGSK